MTAILFVVILIVVNQMKPAKEGEFHRDYLCKEKTTAINELPQIVQTVQKNDLM